MQTFWPGGLDDSGICWTCAAARSELIGKRNLRTVESAMEVKAGANGRLGTQARDSASSHVEHW